MYKIRIQVNKYILPIELIYVTSMYYIIRIILLPVNECCRLGTALQEFAKAHQTTPLGGFQEGAPLSYAHLTAGFRYTTRSFLSVVDQWMFKLQDRLTICLTYPSQNPIRFM